MLELLKKQLNLNPNFPMVAINFHPQFAEDVEYGKKRQTIRRKVRCKIGDRLQLYTGQRTKKCRLLDEVTCNSIAPVKICDTEMFLNGKRLIAGNALRDEYEDRDNDFAQKDGFDSFVDMADWFRERYGTLPFEGYVIRW